MSTDRRRFIGSALAAATACVVTLAACSSSHKQASATTSSSTTSGTQPSVSANDPGTARFIPVDGKPATIRVLRVTSYSEKK